MILRTLLVAIALLTAAPAAAQLNGCNYGSCNSKFGGVVNVAPPILTLGPPLFVNQPSYAQLQGGLTSYASTSLGFSWVTSSFTKCHINYGTTSAYGSAVNESAFFLTHTLTMTGLTPDTDYNYMIVCVDGYSNSVSSANLIASTQSTQTLAQLVARFGGTVGSDIGDIAVPSHYSIQNTSALR